jgi:asparagine synthase (glutamine-hydrolysing)
MCGLWAYFLRHGNLFDTTDYVRHDPWKHASANRGPDTMSEVQGSDYHLVFHRLAIRDTSLDGDQPFSYEFPDGTTLHVMCNGEIYNYDALVEKYRLARKLKSRSDCEVIGHLFETFKGDELKVAKALHGEWAFVARFEYPDGRVRIVAARDAYGVRPLYMGTFEKGIIFSSTLSGIVGFTEDVRAIHFPPGHIFAEVLSSPNEQPTLHSFATPLFKIHAPSIPTDVDVKQSIYKLVTDALIEAVRIRLATSERNIGFLLSGGLDSSLVVAIATKILGYQSPPTFCIGLQSNATDLAYAQKVASYLGTRHHQVIVPPKEALAEVRDVIKALETYDITTIRASVPQYILAKYISERTDVRVVMNGDGSDEVASGYLYNYYAPSPQKVHADALRLLNEIHMFDGLRVDRTLGAHGLEARLPFLDPKFVATYLGNVPAEWRTPHRENGIMEKQFLRDAFATLYPGLLPTDVLYRKKEAFSDGVSVNTQEESWFRILQNEFGHESDYYKDVFDAFLPNHRHVLPHYWMPPKDWVGASDPSARTLATYSGTE